MFHSILKQSSTIRGPPRTTAQQRETARFHADLIQQRRDVESQILFATETLLDFPPSPDSNSAQPAQEDINIAKTFLKCFQPSDYDALIEERNIDKKCGYIFCPNANRKQDTDARCRILQSKDEGKKTLKFVDRHLLERWCSDECAKRALFVRVQLSDEPAWTRAGDFGEDIAILDDADSPAKGLDSALAEKMQKLSATSKADDMAAALDQLAIERGNGQAHNERSVLVDVHVYENTGLHATEPEKEVAKHSDR